jgi:hypothetical protein
MFRSRGLPNTQRNAVTWRGGKQFGGANHWSSKTQAFGVQQQKGSKMKSNHMYINKRYYLIFS